MSEEDDSEREFDPTPHKLEEARRKGDIVRSSEITVAAAYGGILLASLALGGQALIAFGEHAMVLLDQADGLSRQMLGGGSAVAAGVVARMLGPAMLWLLAPAVLVLLALLAQRAIVVAPDKIMPKLSRIDPLGNARQKFGRTGLFEFLKSFVKLAVIAVILGRFLSGKVAQIIATQEMGVPVAVREMLRMLLDFLTLLAVIAVVIAAIDYLWQRAEFLRRNRMTRKELIDEMKQSEGDPHIRQQRRQKAIAIATRQMISEVAKADVVVVNPTHYAVALQWQRGSGRAPVCIAKGVDEIAARIREVAQKSAVPIHSDPPTARALYATIDIGAEIRPEQYRAVAAAIRFAEKMRARAKGRR
ncbi:EscU/YscU/HrcU family type III secretion system export apparatus switch protein [Sinirhodobacter huangdaonensis]|uniref:Flagellar biosynthesis protein FlhB n=1 Tax=Paenirhodobacter huangdaonensis TaxID=2501515 RepID=A0A443LU06_9RHOB|nr:flagellar type III secretion system protein FlhB [Sinirhodobacter huangdaonensis]RWR52616.1 flagellar biosynthesis protein FlhB [Sinirhodobacter huangdaonensis]